MLSPVLAFGMGVNTSSRMMRSGLKSAALTLMPPRVVRTPAPAGTTGISPKLARGPTTAALSMRTSMPSMDSQKSMPSAAASKVPLSSTDPVASSSITAPGGTRPPGPTSVAAGVGAVPVTVTVGAVSSVIVRLVEAVPRNSATSPVTSTAAPTATVGAALVNTNRPSLDAGSASASAAVVCIQKPLLRRAVTTPGTSRTRSPT